MKTRFILLMMTLSIFYACVDRDYGVPSLEGNCVTKTANKSVGDIVSLATAVPALYEADDIIEAYVTSSDEGGNFFKNISMVATDNSVGFSIPVDQVTLYADYEPGRKVYVNLKDRFISVDHSSMVVGNQNINPSFPSGLSRLELFQYRNVIQKSCEKVDEETLVLKDLNIAQAVNNANLHKIIEFENVQFTGPSIGKTFFDASLNNSGNATNHELIDENGNVVIVRVSLFSNFSGVKVPTGSGKVRGVLTKFNNTFQFMPRSLSDIKLDNPRIDNTVYLESLNETFESFNTNVTSFQNYINYDFAGSKLWRVATFGGNKYIQMSSFTSNTAQQDPLNKSYFIVPVNFTAINTLSFKTKAGFANGACLRVYLSTEFIPFVDINQFNKIDITSQVNIDPGQASGYPNDFTNSGVFNIPTSLVGNGFIIFEYTGGYGLTPIVTTTMQIDDIVIN
ncbi:MAG: DUF5689 domain-containing protein [Flavobacterium sp.]